MAKKIRKTLVDYPPDEPKENICYRQVGWPQSLFDSINKIAAFKGEPFQHVVVKAMRIWVIKQEEDEN